MKNCAYKIIDSAYHVAGRIDETFVQDMDGIPYFGEINFNLKNLISINSSGIRAWVILMQKMKTAYISLYECPKAFIDQVNMVNGFIPNNARIVSFYVPYYNEKNKTEKQVLFILGQDFKDSKLMPLKKISDDQGEEMELDVIEAKYFKFLKS